MRRLGIAALDRGPNTSKPDPDHKIYPYLLGDLVVDRANQVWAEDIFCLGAADTVYLRAYDSVAEARASTGRYLGFLNRKRPLVF